MLKKTHQRVKIDDFERISKTANFLFLLSICHIRFQYLMSFGFTFLA